MRSPSPWRCWPLSWLLLVFSSGALSQEAFFNIRHFSVEEGMSSRFVTNTIQDKQGFIWVGTDYGVNRFDGRNFKTYHSNRSKLRVNTRTYLFLDLKGNIWTNNERRRVDIIDPQTDQVFPLETLAPEFEDKLVRIRGRDRWGVIWGTVENEFVFRYDGRFHFTSAAFFKKEIDKLDNVFSSPWGTLFFAKPEVLLEFDSLGNQLNAYPMPKQEFSSANLTDSSVIIVRLDRWSNRNIVRAHIWELKECNTPQIIQLTKKGKPVRLDDSTNSYASVGANRDAQERLWVTFLNQLQVFDKRGELIATAPTSSDFWQNLEADRIFFDTQGQAWVRGRQGVFLFSMQLPSMRKMLQGTGIGISVRGLAQLGYDKLLACTYDGLYAVNIKSGLHKKLNGDIYFGAVNEGDSAIWLGSHAMNITRFDLAQHKYEQIKISVKLNKLDEYLRPFVDSLTGQIFIGTRRQGLLVYDKNTKEVVPYNQLNQFTEFAKLEIIYLLPTPECIWACTNDGLFQIDRQKGIIAKHNSFPSNYIYHLAIDNEGIFWISTRGGGLIKWFRKSNIIRQYTVANGLSHDVIYAAFDDGKGHLWLPSNYGLMRFDKNTGSVVNYLPEEGASGEEFNSDSRLVGSDGTFYFGGLTGVTAFHPDSISHQQFTQPLVVTSLKMLDGNSLQDRLPEFRMSHEILVRPNERFFTLEFAMLDFHAKKLVYAWNLEGLDKNWTVQTESSIRFNGLPYGKYVLRLRAQGTGSIWSENHVSIPIIVIRPFYKTLKFFLLCVLVFILITFLSVRWRIRWLRREKRRLAQVVEERTAELSKKNAELESTNQVKDRLFGIIAHDLRSPLITLGDLARKVAFLMRQGRVQEIQELGDTVEGSVANVRNLLDNLLKWSIVEDGKFLNNPEPLQIGELIKDVIELYKTIAETKGISLQLNNVNDPKVFADRNALSTIIRNLVDNALKFTYENGKVTLFLSGNETSTTLKVCDTGMGIPAEALLHIFNLKGNRGQFGTKGERGNGLGLVLCKELVEMNQGTILAENQPSGGAVFTVVLPAAK